VAGEPDRVAELTGVLEVQLRALFGDTRLGAVADRIPDLASAIALVERHSADATRIDFFRPGRD
jgi:hypothetical protein